MSAKKKRNELHKQTKEEKEKEEILVWPTYFVLTLIIDL